MFLIGLEKITFAEYLKTTNLTENLIQYVSMCIAMTEEDVSALEVSYILLLILYTFLYLPQTSVALLLDIQSHSKLLQRTALLLLSSDLLDSHPGSLSKNLVCPRLA